MDELMNQFHEVVCCLWQGQLANDVERIQCYAADPANREKIAAACAELRKGYRTSEELSDKLQRVAAVLDGDAQISQTVVRITLILDTASVDFARMSAAAIERKALEDAAWVDPGKPEIPSDNVVDIRMRFRQKRTEHDPVIAALIQFGGLGSRQAEQIVRGFRAQAQQAISEHLGYGIFAGK